MLALGRRFGESIVIADGDKVLATVEVVRQRGSNQIVLGVEAPKEVAVHRKEYWDELQRKQGGEK